MSVTITIVNHKHSCFQFRKGVEILQDIVHTVRFVLIMFSAKYMGFGGF